MNGKWKANYQRLTPGRLETTRGIWTMRCGACGKAVPQCQCPWNGQCSWVPNGVVHVIQEELA